MDGRSVAGPNQVQPKEPAESILRRCDCHDSLACPDRWQAFSEPLNGVTEAATERGGAKRSEPRTRAAGGSADTFPRDWWLIRRQLPEESAEELTEVQANWQVRLDRITKRRRWSLAFAEWGLEQVEDLPGTDVYERALFKLRNCATWLLVRRYTAGPMEGSSKVAGGNFCCQPRICPGCAHYRMVRILREYVPKVEAAIDAGLVPVMATWTVKDGPDLRERLDHLKDGLRRLWNRRRRQRNGDRGNSELAKVEGGLVQIENKLGKFSRLHHPHAHGILLVDGRMDFQKLSEEWSDIVGYSAQSRFKVVKEYWSKDYLTREEFHEQLSKAVIECVKYPTKFQGTGFEEVWDIYLALKARERLMSSFGVLRGSAAEDYGGELTEEDWPYEEIVYRWLDNQYLKEEVATL